MFNEIQAQLPLNTIATCTDDHIRSDAVFFFIKYGNNDAIYSNIKCIQSAIIVYTTQYKTYYDNNKNLKYYSKFIFKIYFKLLLF